MEIKKPSTILGQKMGDYPVIFRKENLSDFISYWINGQDIKKGDNFFQKCKDPDFLKIFKILKFRKFPYMLRLILDKRLGGILSLGLYGNPVFSWPFDVHASSDRKSESFLNAKKQVEEAGVPYIITGEEGGLIKPINPLIYPIYQLFSCSSLPEKIRNTIKMEENKGMSLNLIITGTSGDFPGLIMGLENPQYFALLEQFPRFSQGINLLTQE